MNDAAIQPGPPAGDDGPHGAPDAELVLLARGGATGAERTRAFAALVERHQPRVYALLRRRIASSADAEDLAQETFVRAWQSLDRFDTGRCFRTWIHTIASRLAVDHLRSRSAAVRRDRKAGRERARREVEPPRAWAEAADGDGVWATARQVLSDAAFTALWLRYVEGLQAGQIARVLGKNRVAVSMMLCRARDVLAGHLAQHRPEEAETRSRGGAGTDPRTQPAAGPAVAQGASP